MSSRERGAALIFIDELGCAGVCAGLHGVQLSGARAAEDIHLRFEDGVLDMCCAINCTAMARTVMAKSAMISALAVWPRSAWLLRRLLQRRGRVST